MAKKKIGFFSAVSYVFLAILTMVLLTKGYSAIRSYVLSPQQKWLEDLSYLEKVLTEEHVGLWLHGDSTRINIETERVKNQILSGDIDSLQILTELSKIVARVGDPHTYVDNRYSLMGIYPFYIYWFDEGPYLISVRDKYKKYLGSRVVKINDIEIEEVYQAMKVVVPHSNPSGYKDRLPGYLRIPTLLHGLGITEHADTITLTIYSESKGLQELNIEKLSLQEFQNLKDYKGVLSENQGRELPLYLQNRGKNYWFTHVDTADAVYVKYNAASDMEEEEGSIFWQRVLSFTDSVAADKFILDLRDNSGGDNFFHLPLLAGLIERPNINREGHLFTLIDRGTFSAAITCAADLEKKTETIFAGESFGDLPNTTGDPRFFTLPHSGLTVGIATIHWLNTHIYDTRNSIIPDINVGKSIQDYIQRKDPVLEQVFMFEPDIYQSNYQPNDTLQVKGKFEFTADQNLEIEIKENGAVFNIDGLITDSVYSTGSGSIFADRYSMMMTYLSGSTDSLRIRFHDTVIIKPRMNNSDHSPLELLLDGKFNEAEELYFKLRKASPKLPLFDRTRFNMLAWHSYYLENNYDTAIDLINMNARLNPDDPFVYIRLGQMYNMEGEKWKAIGAFGKVFTKSVKRYFTMKNMNDHYLPF